VTHILLFTLTSPVAQRDALLDLNLEHMAWVDAGIEKSSGLTSRDLSGMELPEYVASMIDKVCGEPPPRGAFHRVHGDGEQAGMGGLRPLGTGVCEIKRIYVRPTARTKARKCPLCCMRAGGLICSCTMWMPGGTHSCRVGLRQRSA
jgi:hypothetical protein